MTDAQDQIIDQSLPAVGELQQLAEQSLARVQQAGASAAAVGVSQSVGLTVTVRAGDVESIEFQRDRDLGVTVYRGQHSGSASTADWAQASIEEAARRAVDISRFTGADPYGGLPDPERLADPATCAQDLDLHHPWSISVAEAIELARACEAAALAADPRIDHSEGASVNLHSGIQLLANSHGFVGHSLGSSHGISCAVVARDGDAMERDYWYTSARLPAELEAPDAVGQRAGERAAARLGARAMPSGQRPVLYVPELARGLIGSFLGAISGGALYRKHSFLIDAKGETLFPEWLQIDQAPHIPQAVGSRWFDREGVATTDRSLVDDGVLQGYLLGSYSARRLGLESTGNSGGAFNVTVASSPARPAISFDELLAEMGDGLLVTELMGQGVNATTGDYSRGAAGFAVRGGQLAEPVSEITVAGNLRDMYANIRAIGSDVDTRGNTRCGSILVDGMMVAGH